MPWIALAALALALAPASAHALEPMDVDVRQGPQSLLQGSEYLADPTGAWSLEEVRREHAQKFEPVRDPNMGFTEGSYWMHLTLRWPERPVPLTIAFVLGRNLRSAHAHILHEGQPAVVHGSGWDVPLSERYLGAGHAAFPCQGSPNTLTEVWIRVQGDGRPLHLNLEAHGRGSYEQKQIKATSLNWLFAGAMLMLALYQGVQFLGSRDRAALFFVAVVLSQVGVDVIGGGHLQQVIGFEDPLSAGRPKQLVVLLMNVSWCLFTRDVLEVPRYSKWLDRALQAVAWLALPGVLLLFVPGQVGLALYLAVPPAAMIACMSSGVLTARQGYRPARLYLFTWGAMFAFVITGVLVAISGKTLGGFTDQLFRLGPLCQVMGFALVLSQRAAAVRQDLAQSQAREVEAQRERLQAQDKALRVEKEAAETLQAKVDERTSQLAQETSEADRQRQDAERAREDAEQAHAKIEEMDRQKTRFFQNISHELRTPLTLVLNPLEDAARDHHEDPRLQVAERNARRLLRLVNQLLDFQKIEAGKRKLALQNVDLVRFAWVCGDYVRSQCAGRDITFRVLLDHKVLNEADLGEKQRFIRGEIDSLEKIVFNYLSNAMKFTPDGGEIHLEILTGAKNVRIGVSDTGPGISPANQGKLFQLFSQVDDSATRGVEGTGLGLALVKELTEAMQGQVGVDTDEGQGSRFWSIFPSVLAPSMKDGEADLQGFEVRPWLLADQAGTEREEPEPLEDGDGQHVLVVDDLADMRELIGSTLRRRDYRVSTAKDGVEGVAMAREQVPDLIITDWMMPRKTGIDLIAELRADDAIKHLPVVLLTARSDEEGKLLGTEVGADAFLGKPFNEQELHATVRNLLSLKQHEKDLAAAHHQLREGVLKRYLPPALVDRIVANDGEIGVEHESRSVTVLFVDLCGFTALSFKLRASAIARILNAYLGEMTRVIFEHGGTIDKFIGDAVMVLFGAPEHMDSARQARNAASCALAMQEAMDALNARWGEEDIGPLQIRVGIHHGPAVVGNFGSEQRLDYTAIGDTVNTAARIENQSNPGEILISPATADLLPEEVIEQAGEFELKGLRHPIVLYRIPASARKALQENAA